MAGMPRRRARRNAGLLEDREERALRYTRKGTNSHPEFVSVGRLDYQAPVRVEIAVYGFEPHPLGWTLVGSLRFSNSDGPPHRWSENWLLNVHIDDYPSPHMGTVQVIRYGKPGVPAEGLASRIVRDWFKAHKEKIVSLLPRKR